MPFNPDKLAKIQAKSSASRTGGKGSVRRKKKTVRKSAVQDDKKVINTLNRLNVRDIPAIEEVNLFKNDGTVIHFTNPKGLIDRMCFVLFCSVLCFFFFFRVSSVLLVSKMFVWV